MKNKIFIAVLLTITGVSLLVYSAVVQSAKAVVTVSELAQEKSSRTNIRLGARVSSDEINYKSQPDFILRFNVHDITSAGAEIPVVYHGIMPDTLRQGRDVILEGNFDGREFTAKSLLTQCPSKYEPPKPGE